MKESPGNEWLHPRALVDAVRSAADCFVLVTGDYDQAGTVYALRHEFGKKVLVFNPHVAVSEHLKRAATFYAHIPPRPSCEVPASRDNPHRYAWPHDPPSGGVGIAVCLAADSQNPTSAPLSACGGLPLRRLHILPEMSKTPSFQYPLPGPNRYSCGTAN